MDGQALLDRVREENETELSRLGSEKALLAATDATLAPEAVLGALADALATGRRALDDWADAADDPALADAMAEGASRLASLLEDHRDVLPADPDVEAPVAVGEPAGDVRRAAAGLVGLPLVLDPLCLQSVNFFVNEADEATAEAVRAIRDGVRDLGDEGVETLAEAATEADAEDDAVAAAGAVIQAAYAAYADRLEAMGLDPKPIC